MKPERIVRKPGKRPPARPRAGGALVPRVDRAPAEVLARLQASAGNVAVARQAAAARDAAAAALRARSTRAIASVAAPAPRPVITPGPVAPSSAAVKAPGPIAPSSTAATAPGLAAPSGGVMVSRPSGRVSRLVARFGWGDVAGAVSGAVGALGLDAIKNRVLGTIAGWARRIPGYDLLCFALGRDPVADRPVERNAQNLVGGVLGLVPGGQALWANLQQSGALDRTFAWLGEEIPKLGLTWDTIRGLFSRAWDSLSASDLLNPAGAWERLAAIFGPPLARLRAFAGAAALKVAEFVFEAVAGGSVMGVIRQAGAALGSIVRDPIGFARNLISAVRGGLGRFVANIGAHLQTGLFGWLTGALGGVIKLPARFDLRGILSLVLDVLGVTWAAVRTRLVRLLGDPLVSRVETAVDWIQRIVTGGLGAVADRNLADTVLGGIRDWVARSVVGTAITKLISMFNPAGAVLQAILAVYNTFQFFMERAQQIAALGQSVIGSIAAIASGNIGNAIAAVEQALARTVPVVLGFLARLIGLGDIAAPVRRVIDAVRAPIDRALDRVADWLAGIGRRAVGAIGGQRGTAETSASAQAVGTPPAPGTVVATTSTSAGGHTYEGRAVVVGQALQVQVQREVVPAAPAAAASAAATGSIPARAQLNGLVRKVRRLEAKGLPISRPDVERINVLLREVIQTDLAAAASLYSGPTGPLAAHAAEFASLTAPSQRRDAYYMSLVSWRTTTAAIRARDLPRIIVQIRDLGQHWIDGDALTQFVESLYDIRLGSEGADDEIVPEVPKYVPRDALAAFRIVAKPVEMADRASRSVNRKARDDAVKMLIGAVRDGPGQAFGVDHRRPLSSHWNSDGHRMPAEVRAQVAGDPTNLVLVSASWNSSKGGEHYITPPAIGFTRRLGESVAPAPSAPTGPTTPSGLIVT
jgi:hypothetical protein